MLLLLLLLLQRRLPRRRPRTPEEGVGVMVWAAGRASSSSTYRRIREVVNVLHGQFGIL
jgi:hypothetical protein